jgi:hypothetical protein
MLAGHRTADFLASAVTQPDQSLVDFDASRAGRPLGLVKLVLADDLLVDQKIGERLFGGHAVYLDERRNT